jgi:hypothetical protein
VFVNFKCLRMASKRRLDMYACKRNGAPMKMSGLSIAQNNRLGTPWVVASKNRIAKNRRNSSHVSGSESVVFVAVITVF